MQARAEIIVEPDDQYTTIILIDGVIQPSPTANQTLAAAFNKGRDEIAALISGGLKVKRAIINATIE